ncbi:MAG: plastocyanin/azurin family copper-binding protein [Acidimicrobiales bacterium]
MTGTITPRPDREQAADGVRLDAPEGRTRVVLGAGEEGWLTLVTIIAVAALVLAYAAFVRAGGRKTVVMQGGAGVSTEVTWEAGDFFYKPNTATAPAGTPISITLDNTGTVIHEFVVLQEGASISKESEYRASLVFAKIDQAAAGGQSKGSITFDRPGAYQVVCTIPSHFDAGMKGSLTVQ